MAGTPPPGVGGRPLPRPGMMMGRASSSSLPRSPDNDPSYLTSGLGTGSGSLLGGSTSGQSGQGSLGSHSSHDVNFINNIYQNTNHPHLYDTNLDGSPRHSLGSNSSNLSTPPSPAREIGSSSYES